MLALRDPTGVTLSGVGVGGLDSWIPKGPSSSLYPRAVECLSLWQPSLSSHADVPAGGSLSL